jgi:tRNA C32,U32 (ribose-2'-O)-methylase TrmJ
MTVFTAVIAVSTIIYTIVTFRLWKTTQGSVDIAKATVLMSYLSTLAQEIEKTKATNPQAAMRLQQVAMLVTEVSLERFLEDINFSKQPHVRDAMNKLDGLLRANGVDPQNVPWFRPVAEKMKAGK